MFANDMTHKDNITAAADHYGLESQLLKVKEELYELHDAISLGRFDGKGGIYEEMADVYNMLDQLCYLTGAEDTVRDIAEAKMERIVKRILEEQNEP